MITDVVDEYVIDKYTKLDIERSCRRYGINPKHLSMIINHKKVVPMIRGIGAEYHLLDIMKQLKIYAYKNEEQDKDCFIEKYVAENKLAEKNSAKIEVNGVLSLRVKCMRSRTSGEKKCKERAKALGLDYKLCKIHSDQYRKTDFDIVVTNIGNAFMNDVQLRDWLKDHQRQLSYPYSHIYWAWSRDLISTSNNQCCQRRRGCDKDCGFIPHYPIMTFPSVGVVNYPWRSLKELEYLSSKINRKLPI